jgi:2-(1,2-epoxy-1,2-dihydrophenyl)acetyl-CoA isomerase
VNTDVDVVDEDAVRTLVLDGPARRNVLAVSTVERVHDEVLRAERESRVGALVLTGAGEHFSAGGDLDEALAAIAEDTCAEFMRAFARMITSIWQSPLPVVAAVGGIVYGAGFNLALSCDLIVSARTARFCQVFQRRGLVPDAGGTYLLPRLVGMQRAKELMLLAEEIDVDTAAGLGLVNVVVDTPAQARAHATGLAHRLADRPRLAVSQTKRMLNASTAGTLQSSLELEVISQAAVLRSPETQRNFEAFLAH